jgi:hypothetical protein
MNRLKLNPETRLKLQELDENPRAWKLLGYGYLVILLPLLILGFLTIAL